MRSTSPPAESTPTSESFVSVPGTGRSLDTQFGEFGVDGGTNFIARCAGLPKSRNRIRKVSNLIGRQDIPEVSGQAVPTIGTFDAESIERRGHSLANLFSRRVARLERFDLALELFSLLVRQLGCDTEHPASTEAMPHLTGIIDSVSVFIYKRRIVCGIILSIDRGLIRGDECERECSNCHPLLHL